MNKKSIISYVILVIAFLSLALTPYIASPTNFINKSNIEKLEEKKETVMKLTAATTSASAAITLIPGDAGTPIAEKLADLSGYFLIALSAIVLEKYLLVLTQYSFFGLMVPILGITLALYILNKKHYFSFFARKILPLGLALVLLVPLSVNVSNLIEKTFESSIETTIQQSEETTTQIKENKFNKDTLSSWWDKVSGTIMNDFIESVAIMIVTSCIIPVLVLVFFVWIFRMSMSLLLTSPRFKEISLKNSKLIGNGEL